MTAPLSHCHATTQIPAGGLAAVWTATPEEREAVRAALEILACDRLEVRYRIRVTGDGVWRLAGTLEADVTQACVVTLDPVAQAISADLEAEFRRVAEPDADEIDVGDPFSGEVEPVEDGVIDIGRLVYEEIATRLDPFPRAADATLDQSEAGGAEPQSASPFAALKGLKLPSKPETD